MSIKTRVSNIEKRIKERDDVNDRCMPIGGVSEKTREKYKKLGMPIPILINMKSL